MEYMYLIAGIISVVGSVDMALAQNLANNKQSAIYKEAQKILNEISKDRAVASALHRAALRGEEALLRELINSHPVSSRSRAIMKQYAKQAKEVDTHAAKLDQLDKKAQNVSNNVQTELAKAQSSGSFIGDMLAAGAKKIDELSGKGNPVARLGVTGKIGDSHYT